MDPFKKRLESVAAQRSLLAQVDADANPIAPITAVTCGVVPLPARDKGSRRDLIYLAAGPSVHPDVFGALSRALARPIESVRCDENLVRQTIERVYLRDANLNLPTFRSSDFLRDDRRAGRLLAEKVEPLPRVHLDLDADHLVLVDLALHSILENLDADEPVEIIPGAAELAFKVIDGRPVLFGDETPGERVRLVVQRSYYYDGCEHVQGINGDLIDELPHRIHPTEMQLIGVGCDGTVTFHLYDRTASVRPGETGQFEISYYYLRYGMRYRRRLELLVRGVWLFPREALRYGSFSAHAQPDDLERLFGLDFHT